MKQMKGKAAEIGTEASVPVGTTVNTGCTPVKKQRGYQKLINYCVLKVLHSCRTFSFWKNSALQNIYYCGGKFL